MATVPFDRCAAVLAWPDGACALIGLGGMTIGIEPNPWRAGRDAVTEIDRHAPAGLLVHMLGHLDEHIPSRPTPSTNRPLPGEPH